MITLINNHFELSSLPYLTPNDDMAVNARYVDPTYLIHNYITEIFADLDLENWLGKPKLFYIDPVARFIPVNPAHRSIKRGR